MQLLKYTLLSKKSMNMWEIVLKGLSNTSQGVPNYEKK